MLKNFQLNLDRKFFILIFWGEIKGKPFTSVVSIPQDMVATLIVFYFKEYQIYKLDISDYCNSLPLESSFNVCYKMILYDRGIRTFY